MANLYLKILEAIITIKLGFYKTLVGSRPQPRPPWVHHWQCCKACNKQGWSQIFYFIFFDRQKNYILWSACLIDWIAWKTWLEVGSNLVSCQVPRITRRTKRINCIYEDNRWLAQFSMRWCFSKSLEQIFLTLSSMCVVNRVGTARYNPRPKIIRI